MTRALNVDGRKRGTDRRCSRKKSFVCWKRLKLSGHGLQQVVINDMGFLDRYQLFIQQEALNGSVFLSAGRSQVQNANQQKSDISQ